MIYRLNKHSAGLSGEVQLSASKSESNRALLISALMNETAIVRNLSDARDTETMKRLLDSKPAVWDVKDAGTTMRFLTAYLAIKGEGETITGSPRMKERPIGPLADALRTIGAEIDYLEKDGYPPMRIQRIRDQKTGRIDIPGNISSQYISALLMVAPCLPEGLNIRLATEVYSRPYIGMTLDLMRTFGTDHSWKGDTISVAPQSYTTNEYTIENDWSGAGYWLAFMALAGEQGSLLLPNLRDVSFQGDRRVVEILSHLGVAADFADGGVRVQKKEMDCTHLTLDFRDQPDMAQTVMVVAAAKGVSLDMVGLESLKIKETDRIAAMKNELEKLGASLTESGSSWHLKPSDEMPGSVEIETYEDHRMAMAFAPLCQLMDVSIKDPEVVKKSYPGFWEEVRKVGVAIAEE